MPKDFEYKVRFHSKEISDLAKDALKQGTKEAAEILAKKIKEKISVEGNGEPSSPGEPPRKQSGNLYNSVYIDETEYGYDVKISKDVAPYWFYLEYGTRRMKKRPFIRISQAESYLEMQIVSQDAVARAMNAGKKVSGTGSAIGRMVKKVVSFAKRIRKR